MIERISGKIIEKNPAFCILDCHGIGIGLHISLSTFEYLEQHPGDQPAMLSTYLHVREDALQLFGFSSAAEKQMFQLLIGISGVGPKLAIAVLSGIAPDELSNAIASENVRVLTGISGVGKKTAQRIILELKEKIGQQFGEIDSTAAPVAGGETREKAMQAVMALVALGYKQPDAQRAVNNIIKAHGGDASIEIMVKQALREL